MIKNNKICKILKYQGELQMLDFDELVPVHKFLDMQTNKEYFIWDYEPKEIYTGSGKTLKDYIDHSFVIIGDLDESNFIVNSLIEWVSEN